MLEWILSLFTRKTTRNESLIIGILPQEVLIDTEYKGQGVLKNEKIKRYFENSFLEIEIAVCSSYGEGFTIERKEENRWAAERFRKNQTLIDYRIFGLNDWGFTGETRFSTDIIGMLTIQEPKIDFPKAKLFLDSILSSHVLFYRDGHFALIYDPLGDQGLISDLAVLQKLKLKPRHAAEYSQFMIYGGYQDKLFLEGELNF